MELHGPWKRPKLPETYYKGARIVTASCFYHKFTLHANNRGLNLFFPLSSYFLQNSITTEVTKTLSSSINCCCINSSPNHAAHSAFSALPFTSSALNKVKTRISHIPISNHQWISRTLQKSPSLFFHHMEGLIVLKAPLLLLLQLVLKPFHD